MEHSPFDGDVTNSICYNPAYSTLGYLVYKSQSPLAHTRTNRTQARVHFPRRRPKDERDYCVSGNFDVLERTQNVDLTGGIVRRALRYEYVNVRVCENNSRSACVLNGELGLAILPSDTT